MRLIDADALIEAHYNACNEDQNKSFSTWSLQLIRSAPTIDAVPVVRCKDCKHSKPDLFSEEHVVCSPLATMMPCDGFCYYGKRKEDD